MKMTSERSYQLGHLLQWSPHFDVLMCPVRNLHVLLTSIVFVLVALFYARAGQAGASGDIAVMALLGHAPGSIKPTAVVLNSLAALIALGAAVALFRYRRSVFKF